MPYSPMELMTGPVGEWISLIVVTAMFIALAYATLPKHLSQNKKGKALAVTVGLIMGLGLYMVKRTFNFTFESFGLFAIFIIIFIMSLILYNLLKQQFSKEISVCLTYSVIFLSFFMISPSLFDAFSYSFPLLNGILFLTFIISLGFILWRMFGEMSKAVSKGEPLIKIESVDPKMLQKNYDKQKELPNKPKGGKFEMKSKFEINVEKMSDELERIIPELEALNGWIEEKQSKQTSKRLSKLLKTKKAIQKEFSELSKKILELKEINSEVYPNLVKLNNELKGSLHDFYQHLNLANDFIKKNSIKFAMPELRITHENLKTASTNLKSIFDYEMMKEK